MVTRQGAFLVGYTVPIIGIHFEAAELLAEAGRGAGGELARRVEQELASFEARRAGVVDNVRRVQALLAEAGIDAGAPPRLPADHRRWAHAIDDGFAALVSSNPSVDELVRDAARLTGQALGELMQALGLATLVEHLRGAATQSEWLTRQSATIALEQERTATALRRVSESPLIPDGARATLQAMATAALGGARAGQGDPDTNVEAATSLQRRLADDVVSIERAFT